MHGALELVTGLAVAIVPLALGMGAAGAMFAIFLGVLMVGLALGAAAPGGTAAVPVTAHAMYDRLLAAALLATGVGAGIAGNVEALAFFAAAAVAYGALIAVTRYSGQH